MREHHLYALPSQNCTTAHFPLHAHFLAPESPPPPSVCRSSSSLPGGRPTTTSPLQVRSARDLIDDLAPSGPIAVLKGVVGSQTACKRFVSVHLSWRSHEDAYVSGQLSIVQITFEDNKLALLEVREEFLCCMRHPPEASSLRPESIGPQD